MNQVAANEAGPASDKYLHGVCCSCMVFAYLPAGWRMVCHYTTVACSWQARVEGRRFFRANHHKDTTHTKTDTRAPLCVLWSPFGTFVPLWCSPRLCLSVPLRALR